MTQPPAISVIIPTHNRPLLLAVALRSLVWQFFRSFEVIVVNDAGQDVSDVVRDFETSLNIRLLTHSRNKGLSAARNTGIAAAKGKYIAYLDDDDFYYEQHLMRLHDTMEETGAKLVYATSLRAVQRPLAGEYVTVNRSLPFQQDFDRSVLAAKNITPVLAVMHERGCLKRTGGFAEYLFAHEDWDLWLRLARHFDFHHLNEITSEYTMRTDGSSMSISKRKDMRDSWLFTRCYGVFCETMPPVNELERRMAAMTRVALSTATQNREGTDTDSQPRASIVLPMAVWDAGALAYLAALCASLGDIASAVELILVGSGISVEPLAAAARSLAKEFIRPPSVLHIPHDAGRVLAANAGADIATGEWLIFLEDEVQPRLGWLHTLLYAAKSTPTAGVLGGVLELSDTPPLFGGIFTELGEPVLSGTGPKAGQSTMRVDAVSSLCLMVRHEQFAELGGFDAAFAPGHFADADLCLRLRKKGLTSHVAADARLIWNKANTPLLQSPAGIVSRRSFLDLRGKKNRPLEQDITGNDWSKRARLWPSDGTMPENFEVDMPKWLAG